MPITPFSIPGRASDAGPESLTPMNRQNLYSLLTEEVCEDARRLDHLYLDRRGDERRQRLALIDSITERLRQLREVV